MLIVCGQVLKLKAWNCDKGGIHDGHDSPVISMISHSVGDTCLLLVYSLNHLCMYDWIVNRKVLLFKARW